jgi:hypothetical protein
MEKQTKILLGLAAAGVVAYLILKGKKTSSTTDKLSSILNKNDRLICPDGYTFATRVVGGVVGLAPACKDKNGNWSNVVPILNPNYVLPSDSDELITKIQPIGKGTRVDCGDGTFATDALPCGSPELMEQYKAMREMPINANGLTIQKLSKEIGAAHTTIPVDLNAVTPNYGKPINVLFKNHSGQMNFVDVIHNDYFKPQKGTFRPIEGYSNPNISGVPVNILR